MLSIRAKGAVIAVEEKLTSQTIVRAALYPFLLTGKRVILLINLTLCFASSRVRVGGVGGS